MQRLGPDRDLQGPRRFQEEARTHRQPARHLAARREVGPAAGADGSARAHCRGQDDSHGSGAESSWLCPVCPDRRRHRSWTPTASRSSRWAIRVSGRRCWRESSSCRTTNTSRTSRGMEKCSWSRSRTSSVSSATTRP